MLESSIKGKTLKRIMAACCATSFCMYGYDAGVLGGVQETEPFRKAMGFPTGTYVIPMIASSYTLAAAVCSLMVSMIGMRLGRRNCILLGNLCVLIGGSLQASSWSVAQMIAGRIICGFGIGFISCSIPTYQAEMSTEIGERGPEVAVTCVLLVAGAAIAYWIDFGFTRMTNQISWRFPIAFQTVFALIAGGGMLLLPDTPRWYYARGRYAEGDVVLCRLYDAPLDDPAVQNMKQGILASIKLEEVKENGFQLLDLIWDRSDLRSGRRIRISFMILSLQQMMGL
ncbi:general substrate transporter, partial [Bisporella sp. PMI_857]